MSSREECMDMSCLRLVRTKSIIKSDYGRYKFFIKNRHHCCSYWLARNNNTVTVSNWNKNPDKPAEPVQQHTQTESLTNSQPIDTNDDNAKVQASDGDTMHSTKLLVNQLANNFLKELKFNNINSLVDMSEVPFYYEDKLITRISTLRSSLQEDVPKSSKTFPKVKFIKTQTVREWEQENPFKGNPTEWQVLSRLKISDNGYISVASLEGSDEPNASISIFIDKIGAQFKIVGIFE